MNENLRSWAVAVLFVGAMVVFYHLWHHVLHFHSAHTVLREVFRTHNNHRRVRAWRRAFGA